MNRRDLIKFAVGGSAAIAIPAFGDHFVHPAVASSTILDSGTVDEINAPGRDNDVIYRPRFDTFEEASNNNDCAVSQVTDGTWWPSSSEWALMDYINTYRAQNGLGRVEMSRSLAGAAHHHAYYMAAHDVFGHDFGGTTWSQNIYNYGYPCCYLLAEDIAAGRSSASGTLQQWKDSPAHNDVLMDSRYIRVGIGHVYIASSTYDHYWVADFGSKSHRTIYE